MDDNVNQMYTNRLYRNRLASHMSKGFPWNPLSDHRIMLVGEAALPKIKDEECQKINSMSREELFEFVKLVTKSKIWPMTLRFYESFVFPDGIDPNQLVFTVMSILVRIQFRIKAEWESLKSTTNTTGMTTLKEIMSENITSSERTVFHLVHKHMQTMNGIDQPIKSFPRGLTTSARKIQKHYQSIVTYIKDFQRLMKKRRAQAIETCKEQEEYRQEKQRIARKHAKAISRGKLQPSFSTRSALDRFGPTSPKRRRF